MDSAAARIVLDVSTSLGFRLSPPNKYTRVEHTLITELNTDRDQAVAVRRDGATFVSANGAVAPDGQNHPRNRVERLIGACIGRANSFGGDGARHWNPFDHRFAAAAPFAFEARDLVLLAGASWYHLDLTGMRRLKEKVGFTLVGLVYDLLPIHYPSFITVDGRQRYREFLLELAGLADLIVTPSVAVAAELRDFLCQQDVLAMRALRPSH